MTTYVNTDLSLPRSLDVQISLSRPQAETRTNLSVLCLVAEDLGLLPDANRIRYYSTMDAVAADFASITEPYHAAAAFFAQSPRPTTMAVAEAFLDPIPAQLAGSVLSAANIAAIAAVEDGSMSVSYDPGTGSVTQVFSPLDFSDCENIEDIAAVIDAASGAGLTCAVKTFPGGNKVINITTVATGDDVTIAFPVIYQTGDPLAPVGTYVGTLLKLTDAAGGSALAGYTPTDIAGELDNITAAANSANRFVYGWCFGAGLRVAATQVVAAEWALAHIAIMPLVTNDIIALNAAEDEDLGSLLQAADNRRVCALYHDNAQRYPDVSILAYMLSVNYQIQDSTVTAKFKQLPGIETVQLTETEWTVLRSKGYNTYTAVGNSSRTYRDGVTESSTWYMDSTINLDNFVEDLSVNVFNVFLRNKKIPYTRKGQMLLVDACRDTANQYEYNGTFADREIADNTRKGGVKTLPAVQIIPTPISSMSVADRASRIGPPIEMIAQEAGAIHSVAIAVEVVN